MILLLGSALALAEPMSEDQAWGLTQGLMAGVVVAHAVQPAAVLTGDLAWKDKHVVAISGTALYGATLAGLAGRKRWALWVATIGPAVGLSSVLTGWALGEAGVIDAKIRPDVFQMAGGAIQVPAAVISVDLLRRTRPDQKAMDEARVDEHPEAVGEGFVGW